VQPNPRNRVAYGLHDEHFVLAAVSVPGPGSSGVLFQASNARETYFSELAFSEGRPQARWTDPAGKKVELTSPARLEPHTPAVVALTSGGGAQQLRVNSRAVASGSASFAPAAFDQLLIGWGFVSYYPRPAFAGNIYCVITGKGVPSADEMAVLERYLAALAGTSA
jgi:hypothetical protein